jgi:hypothetical protein
LGQFHQFRTLKDRVFTNIDAPGPGQKHRERVRVEAGRQVAETSRDNDSGPRTSHRVENAKWRFSAS